MEMVSRSLIARHHAVAAWLVTAMAVGWSPFALKAINVVSPGRPAVQVPATPAAPPAKYSAGIAEIVKMVDAKIDPDVIQAYVKSSRIAYNPTANEIIALKDRGVSAEILTAILQRGGEVRAQAQRAGVAPAAEAAPRPSSTAAGPVYAPAYVPGAAPAYPAYSYTYPAVQYVYPSYSYGYPAYYPWYSSYNWGWPYYWPSFSFYWGSCSSKGYCGYPYYGRCGYRYPYYYGGRGCGGYNGSYSYRYSGRAPGSSPPSGGGHGGPRPPAQSSWGRPPSGHGSYASPRSISSGGVRSFGGGGRPAAVTSGGGRPVSFMGSGGGGFRPSSRGMSRPVAFGGRGGGGRR